MLVKWSQWEHGEMVRFGEEDIRTVTKWMQALGLDAARCLKEQEKPHAIYGRKVRDENGKLTEIRMYCNTYLDDEELELIDKVLPHDTLYVVHKREN